jgi:hypothetical protein
MGIGKAETKSKGNYFGQNQVIHTLLGLTNIILNTKFPKFDVSFTNTFHLKDIKCLQHPKPNENLVNLKV